jgi:brefeldin A-inhibited guanine nucleotide-exchange protein
LDASSIWDLCKDPSKSADSFIFFDAVKEFLILTLTRNATNVIIPVFEATISLFCEILFQVKSAMKNEIEIFFTDIIFNILDLSKNIPWYQRYSLLKVLTGIFSSMDVNGGKVFVELYLNYDCDIDAKKNIWEMLVHLVGKLASLHFDQLSDLKFTHISTFVNEDTYPKSLTTANLINISKDQVNLILELNGSNLSLRKQALLFLTNGILEPILRFCIDTNKPIITNRDQVDTPDDAISLLSSTMKNFTTPVDDPTSISLLKQKKQLMHKGFQIFLQDPIKVIC